MTTERTERERRAARHAALGDVTRLAIVDELALGDRSPSELQAVVGLPSNLVAHHLRALEDAGVVARRRSEGDRRRTYLTLVPGPSSEAAVDEVAVGRVMFVCSANSARSQLAAALWAASSDVPVASAGTRPADQVAEGAKAVAARHSLKLLASSPRQFQEAADGTDFVVAVCDSAYEELGASAALHWSVPDPVQHATATAFDDVYEEIRRRVARLAPRLVAS